MASMRATSLAIWRTVMDLSRPPVQQSPASTAVYTLVETHERTAAVRGEGCRGKQGLCPLLGEHGSGP